MDTETLRPNAAGDENAIASQSPADSFPATDHWDKVDEETHDESTTTVYTSNTAYQRDFYNIADHSVGSGTINHIIVYAVATAALGVDQASLKIAIKAGIGAGAPDTPDEGDEETLAVDVWNSFSYQWPTNPATGEKFTWDEIDKLQIGIAMRKCHTLYPYVSKCTQVYVEVDYEPAPPPPPANPLIGKPLISPDIIRKAKIR